MDKEIWKQCPDFEGKYLISNLGHVMSIGTYNTCKKGGILIPQMKKGKDAYYKVRLYNDGKGKTIYIHSLVAKAFVPNPKHYPMVNHIDKDKSNNIWTNLEWCTNKYNIRYSLAKKVDVYTKDGLFVETLNSITDASKKYDIPSRNISRCCKSNYGTSKGLQFRYSGEPFSKKPFVFTNYQYRKSRKGHSCNENRFVAIYEYNIDGTFVKKWDNISAAAKSHGTSTSNICKCYKGKLLTYKNKIFLNDTNIKDRLNMIIKRKERVIV